MSIGSDKLNHLVYDWWVARRPEGWDEQAHLASPTVMCFENDKPMARAIAEAVANKSLMVPVQQAWEAAGGNPGIKAEPHELINVLRLMNEADDEVAATTLTLKQIGAAADIDVDGMTPAAVQKALMAKLAKVTMSQRVEAPQR